MTFLVDPRRWSTRNKRAWGARSTHLSEGLSRQSSPRRFDSAAPVERLLPMQFEVKRSPRPQNAGSDGTQRRRSLRRRYGRVYGKERAGQLAAVVRNRRPQATRVWNCRGEIAHRIPGRLRPICCSHFYRRLSRMRHTELVPAEVSKR